MTELERLKCNLDTLHNAYRLSGMSGKTYLLIDRERDITRQRIADLEAKQAPVDEWSEVKRYIDQSPDKGSNTLVKRYIRHLEAKVAELDNELRCERIDGGKVRDDQNAIDAEKSREKLAELTTIVNAIPPACGLARDLVEKRIESVKREMQGNG